MKLAIGCVSVVLVIVLSILIYGVVTGNSVAIALSGIILVVSVFLVFGALMLLSPAYHVTDFIDLTLQHPTTVTVQFLVSYRLVPRNFFERIHAIALSNGSYDPKEPKPNDHSTVAVFFRSALLEWSISANDYLDLPAQLKTLIASFNQQHPHTTITDIKSKSFSAQGAPSSPSSGDIIIGA